MRAITKPVIAVDEVFLKCISTVKDAVLKQRLTDCVAKLSIEEQNFENRFALNEIYLLPRTTDISREIGVIQMTSVYDYRMVKSSMPGYEYYVKIKSSAPYGKCPLCSVRIVDTVDHYLPKNLYPVYAVTPINLIPACAQCNKEKHMGYPHSSEDQTLHPYYDNVENDLWLTAQVLKTNPVSFEFVVIRPPEWPVILQERVINHFQSFKLNDLFSAHATEELRGARNHLQRLYNISQTELENHLYECYNSRIALGQNSWQAAMYYALFNDNWFCTAGVLL